MLPAIPKTDSWDLSVPKTHFCVADRTFSVFVGPLSTFAEAPLWKIWRHVVVPVNSPEGPQDLLCTTPDCDLKCLSCAYERIRALKNSFRYEYLPVYRP
jgi:hypothetical protein